MNEIYLDHAATTRMKEEVVKAMEPYYIDYFANASTNYEKGKYTRRIIEDARHVVATCIGARDDEIYFTSGGSESDNWVVKGVAKEYKNSKNHIITSQIEHHAILHSCQFLEPIGYDVSYLPVNSEGLVHPDSVERAITEKTSLISIMYGNNEVGTIEPIQRIGRIAWNHGIFFHSDAVQAIGQIPIDVRNLPVDALSASAHKFCGPKGVGFLYVRSDRRIPSFIDGGSQERGKRAGTENIAGIVGMAKALELSTIMIRSRANRIARLRDYCIGRVLSEIKDSRLNGHPQQRLPGNISLSFKGVEATTLLVLLEEHNILASAGSACNTGQNRMSHVIRAMGASEEWGVGTVRLTIGEENTVEEIDYTVNVLNKCVEMLRK